MSQQLSEYEEKRSGVERRQFSYDYHIPERRSGNERKGRLEKQIHKNNKDYFNRQGHLALPFCFFVDFTIYVIGVDKPWVALMAR